MSAESTIAASGRLKKFLGTKKFHIKESFETVIWRQFGFGPHGEKQHDRDKGHRVR